MAELDTFEARFARAYHRYLDDVPTAVDAAAVARMAATQPRTPVLARRSALLPARAFAWVLLAALLLAVMASAALLVGSRRPALGLACPAGTNPDAPGPAAQARPPVTQGAQMAFDRESGRIVLMVQREDAPDPQTWTFDVCTNTWTRMEATGGPISWNIQRTLVYDAESDLTIGVGNDRATWAYDVEADRWDRKSDAPWSMGSMVYDPVADLVLTGTMQGPADLWSYDADADEWRIEYGGLPRARQLMAYDASVDRVVAAWWTTGSSGWPSKPMWLYDPRADTWSASGTWAPSTKDGSVYGYFWPEGAQVAYAGSMGRTVVLAGGLALAYDAAANRWETLYEDPDLVDYPDLDTGESVAQGYAAGPTARVAHTMVYDPVNERLVVYGGFYRAQDAATYVGVRSDDVLAFDPVTRAWTVLLEAANTVALP